MSDSVARYDIECVDRVELAYQESQIPPSDNVLCWRATPAHALACDRASTTRSPLVAMVDPFTLELHGAIVHPGLLVRLRDHDGAAFAVAVWFIL